MFEMESVVGVGIILVIGFIVVDKIVEKLRGVGIGLGLGMGLMLWKVWMEERERIVGVGLGFVIGLICLLRIVESDRGVGIIFGFEIGLIFREVVVGMFRIGGIGVMGLMFWDKIGVRVSFGGGIFGFCIGFVCCVKMVDKFSEGGVGRSLGLMIGVMFFDWMFERFKVCGGMIMGVGSRVCCWGEVEGDGNCVSLFFIFELCWMLILLYDMIDVGWFWLSLFFSYWLDFLGLMIDFIDVWGLMIDCMDFLGLIIDFIDFLGLMIDFIDFWWVIIDFIVFGWFCLMWMIFGGVEIEFFLLLSMLDLIRLWMFIGFVIILLLIMVIFLIGIFGILGVGERWFLIMLVGVVGVMEWRLWVGVLLYEFLLLLFMLFNLVNRFCWGVVVMLLWWMGVLRGLFCVVDGFLLSCCWCWFMDLWFMCVCICWVGFVDGDFMFM